MRVPAKAKSFESDNACASHGRVPGLLLELVLVALALDPLGEKRVLFPANLTVSMLLMKASQLFKPKRPSCGLIFSESQFRLISRLIVEGGGRIAMRRRRQGWDLGSLGKGLFFTEHAALLLIENS